MAWQCHGLAWSAGVVTPVERAKEAEYMASIAEIEAEADRLDIQGRTLVLGEDRRRRRRDTHLISPEVEA